MAENKENQRESKLSVSFEDSSKNKDSGDKEDKQNEGQEESKKPARAKSANVLKNRTFQPPRIDTLKRATQYRLCLSAKPKQHTSPKVLKRRRRKMTDASSGSESDTDQFKSKAYIPHDVDNGPGYFDPSEDYDFDCDDTPRYEIEEKEHSCQIIYKTMCKSLHVTPSAQIHRNLVGSDVILRHHLLGKKGTKALATALVDNLSVKTLILQDNDIRSEGAIYITDMLKENFSISELTLADNSIGTQGLKVLMNLLSSPGHENVVKLNLSGNDFDENDAVYIAHMLEENTIIKDLDLSHNKFREKGGIIIGQALEGNDAIEKLNLSWNHLRREGVEAISQSLERNISIIDLNVSWNGFYLEGSRAMGKALRTNKTLERLDLTCNRIDLECLQELTKGLSGNATLQQLFLSNNPIGSAGAYILLKTIKEKDTIKLEHLDISTQCIEVKFLQLLEELRDRQVIHVRHGIILDQNAACGDGDEEFSHEDPMMVMMELMNVMRLRLIDLFSTLDKDQSRSLSAEELKRGLMSVHVPMTEKAIERLVKKLDTDGDGEVDFGELLEGQKNHNNKIRRLKQLESDLPFAETELGRINFKLKHLMLTGQAQAIKKAQEQREQRARDRLIAMGE